MEAMSLNKTALWYLMENDGMPSVWGSMYNAFQPIFHFLQKPEKEGRKTWHYTTKNRTLPTLQHLGLVINVSNADPFRTSDNAQNTGRRP
jgi:hypothetical protein